jgi:hypothetical protein
MNLTLESANIETVVDDDRDVNVATFASGSDYVSIQICQYEEGDPLLDSPYIEHNGQESGQYDGISSIELHPSFIAIDFLVDQLFEGKFDKIVIRLRNTIDRKVVDFLVNYLFLSKYIRYSDDFDRSCIVSPTAVREGL